MSDQGCPLSVLAPQLFYIDRVEFTQLAADYKAVNLGQGFPDFSPPGYIQEAFCKAVSGGSSMHQYTRAFVSENIHPSQITENRIALFIIPFSVKADGTFPYFLRAIPL